VHLAIYMCIVLCKTSTYPGKCRKSVVTVAEETAISRHAELNNNRVVNLDQNTVPTYVL
jgi:hypothetical protein